MADRSLRFPLVSTWDNRGTREGRRDLERFHRDSRRMFDQAGDESGRRYGMRLSKSLGGGMTASAGIVRRGAGLIAAGFAAAGVAQFAKDSVTMAATFDKTMRQTAAVAKVPQGQIKELRDVALDMGAKTSFSARQAGEAMLELGKGGLSFADQKAGALQATLTLAAAGSLELGEAAGFVVKGLTTFGLRADKATTVAAALAGGANASTASVQDLGLALSQVGPGARNAGLSIQETTGILAAFSNNGIQGADAGTSLKTMLTRLIPTTGIAKEAFKELGLRFTDANGAMLPIPEIAQRIQDKFKGLTDAQRTQAMAQIFGSDATRAATVLMNEGRVGIEKYIRATSDQAAAENLAKTNTEGAAGAFERLQGTIETMQIRVGTLLLPTLADLAAKLARVVDRVGQLRPDLDGLKRAWDANKDSILALVTSFDSANGRAKTAEERAQALTDGLADLTEGIGSASRFLKTLGDGINLVNQRFQDAGADIHSEFVVPVIRDIGRMVAFALAANHKMIAGAATVAEAMHLPMARSLRQAEQRIGQFVGTFNRQIGELHGKRVTISATFGFNTPPGISMHDIVGATGGYVTPRAIVPRRLHRGGLLDGPGTETSDSIPARLSKGEYVVRAKAVKAVGRDTMDWINAQGFAAGGGVDLDAQFPSTRRLTNMVDQFEGVIDRGMRHLADRFDRMAGARPPHVAGGWRAATQFLSALGIPYSIVSTFRPGAVTHASGRQSYHALNRAVDLDGGHDKMRIWSALTRTDPTELIYSRAPRYKSRRGWRPIGALDPITRADHYSHVHAAYDEGGLLPPGRTLAVNNTGRPELVLRPGQLESSFRKPLQSWVVPWLKRIAVGVERRGGGSGGGGGGGGAAHKATPWWSKYGASVDYGTVSQKTWDALYAAGWRGRPGDQAERFYRPRTYDSGGWLMPGTTVARNATGRPERVLPPGEPTTVVNINIAVNGVVGTDMRAVADRLLPEVKRGLNDYARRTGQKALLK